MFFRYLVLGNTLVLGMALVLLRRLGSRRNVLRCELSRITFRLRLLEQGRRIVMLPRSPLGGPPMYRIESILK